MHNPRGSNCRLNEASANRNNANRLCDTQNNNRGGYNVADMHANQGFNQYGTDAQMYDYDNTDWENTRFQFEEVYTAGSEMKVTWTSQHGCGNPKNNCNQLLQWTCDTHDFQGGNGALNSQNSVEGVYYPKDGMRVMLRNGLNTNTPQDPNGINNVQNTFNANNNNNVGRHESEEYYQYAKLRSRNKGLFTADQKVGNQQINTRQNPNGNRSGLEIPEERDYYPYWYPSPWKTAAILHNNVDECEEKMLPFDQANEVKYMCAPPAGRNFNNIPNELIEATTQEECEGGNGNAAGVWREYIQPNLVPKPVCVENEFTQVNNLGNADGTEEGGLPRSWDWSIPTGEQLQAAGCHRYTDTSGLSEPYYRLVFRSRYNMTTGDYDPYKTDASCNQNSKAGIQSPIEQNPTVDVNVLMQGLRLAINTAQTGRTFQDRSHVFRVMEPPAPLQNKVVKNQNVQGKRGNIVQTFPAVEYDFWPKKMNIKTDECISFGWVGSNTHNNGNPAGDGQAGDAGEGQGGTDRHNLVQIERKDETYPLPLDKDQYKADFFTTCNCFKTYTGEAVNSGEEVSEKDMQIYMMSNGYYSGYNNGDQSLLEAVNEDRELNELLNDTPASLRGMTCCDCDTPGEYIFTNTRNNNFSNRDQKLVITVEQ